MTWLTLAWTAIKPFAAKAGAALVRVPWYVWMTVVALAVIWVHLAHDQTAKAEAYARGRAEALAAAHFDSTLLHMTRSALDSAKHRTDSVRTVVRWRTARVDSAAIMASALAQQLPPDLDSLPAIVQLKSAVFRVEAEAQKLTAENDSLTKAIDSERAAHRMAIDVMAAQITQAHLETTREHEARVIAEKRPTRGKMAIVTTTVGVIVGVASFLWGASR